MSEVLSPLAVDLAMSQVMLAAAKAKQAVQPSSADRESAEHLEAALQRLSLSLGPEGDTAAMTEPKLREYFETYLAATTTPSLPFLHVNRRTIQRLLTLLAEFRNQMIVDVRTASDLMECIRQVTEPPSLESDLGRL